MTASAQESAETPLIYKRILRTFPHRLANIKFSFERTAILENNPCLQLLGQILGSPPTRALQAAPLLAGHETITPSLQHSSNKLLLTVPYTVLKVKKFLKVRNRLLRSEYSSGYIWPDHFHAIANTTQSLPWQMQNGRQGMILGMTPESDLAAPVNTTGYGLAKCSLVLVCFADIADCTSVTEAWLKGDIFGWWTDAESCHEADDG